MKDIKALTNAIEQELSSIVSEYVSEPFGITHYGANDIHPKHLVYWICVKTDGEKRKLQADKALRKKLRQVLVDFEYPAEGRKGVHIGFESQQTVDRESKGNWYHHWK
jgi:hypothetical protein